jgi:phosphatidylglycerophosphate synthase
MSIVTRMPPGWQREVLTWPNAVTTVRVFCALGIFLRAENCLIVFALALVGALSDILDGWLARTFDLGTDFGKTFDQWVDWLFGVALLYAIFVAGGLVWDEWPFNGGLLGLIGAYLLIRVVFPLVETIQIAKIKTFMQFTGGVFVLGGHAFELADLLMGGYLLVWSSVGLMGKSLWDYGRKHFTRCK